MTPRECNELYTELREERESPRWIAPAHLNRPDADAGLCGGRTKLDSERNFLGGCGVMVFCLELGLLF
jgi:hypothetical protein